MFRMPMGPRGHRCDHVCTCRAHFVKTNDSRRIALVLRSAVAGMSIDYVKCFNFIAKTVILAMELRLAMDPRIGPALGAAYSNSARP